MLAAAALIKPESQSILYEKTFGTSNSTAKVPPQYYLNMKCILSCG
ncbi:MAG: hypothetical protein JNL70_01945 [Saprospiraceae bacterium]|nr:hypothetical protein [Saprospiraceae bacterium]